jgi:hypothetical protein
MLAKVLQVRGLGDQLVHLSIHLQLFVGLEVPTSELLLNPGKYLESTLVLYFTSLSLVVLVDGTGASSGSV